VRRKRNIATTKPPILPRTGANPVGMEAVAPLVKIETPQVPPFSHQPQVPLPCIDPCVFAVIFDHSLGVTAPLRYA
jgi:hypothetical protein